MDYLYILAMCIPVMIISSAIFRFFRKRSSHRGKPHQAPPVISERNRWLYPGDGFGMMEQGKVPASRATDRPIKGAPAAKKDPFRVIKTETFSIKRDKTKG